MWKFRTFRKSWIFTKQRGGIIGKMWKFGIFENLEFWRNREKGTIGKMWKFGTFENLWPPFGSFCDRIFFSKKHQSNLLHFERCNFQNSSWASFRTSERVSVTVHSASIRDIASLSYGVRTCANGVRVTAMNICWGLTSRHILFLPHKNTNSEIKWKNPAASSTAEGPLFGTNELILSLIHISEPTRPY